MASRKFSSGGFYERFRLCDALLSKPDATAVMVNEHTAFRVDWMPFAGARTSGHGVGGIPYTIHEMQTEKMMVWRSKSIS